MFVAVFLAYNQYWSGGLWFLWFYIQEYPKAQPAVVLALKRLRRRGHSLKSHSTHLENFTRHRLIPYSSSQIFPVHFH